MDYQEHKSFIIDKMIELLNVARNLPVFRIIYKVKAPTDTIEDFIYHNVDERTEDDRLKTMQEIIDERFKLIEEFRKSANYNCLEDNYSYYLFSCVITIQDINYDFVKRLIEEPPVGEFVEFDF